MCVPFKKLLNYLSNKKNLIDIEEIQRDFSDNYDLEEITIALIELQANENIDIFIKYKNSNLVLK